MCGIAGKFVQNSPRKISVELMQSMIGILQHRGPDECGIYIDDYIGLGHARLSIIDLAGGSQPIHNEDQSLWIVYNGEIFNYIELKERLVKKGHHFYTDTDTEVVLHLYEEKGPDCLNELNGQFAIAIWDARKKELFLARDRVGIRPLFYAQHNGSLLFASEIKAIFCDKSIPRQLDTSALDEIFTFWTTLPGKTAFHNIHELSPGHFLIASQTSIQIQRYWDIPFYPPEDQLDWPVDRLCDFIQELLVDAIRIRLRADVPVGCYLSGGLDSSGVTTLVVKNFNNHVKTFGVRFEDAAFDEGIYQHHMVDFLNTDHSEVLATHENIAASLPDVLWHCEKPMLRTAPIPLFLLSHQVHQNNYKVVLTGEGADEVFGGYNIFREAKVRYFWAQQPQSPYRGLLIGKLYPYIFKDPKLWPMQRAFFAAGLDQYQHPLFSHFIRWHNTGKIKTFLSDEFHLENKKNGKLDELLTFLPDSFGTWEPLARAQYLEMMLFMSNYLLSSQGDRVAMAHSIEIRLPYLDYRLLDFMGRVPAKFKLRGLQEKYILKKSFQGIVPERIANRPKHPYRAPIGKSLKHDNLIFSNDLDLIDTFKASGLFNAEKVQRLAKKMETHENASEVDNMALMAIVSTLVIYRQFVKDFPFKTIPDIHPDVMYDRRTNAEQNRGEENVFPDTRSGLFNTRGNAASAQNRARL